MAEGRYFRHQGTPIGQAHRVSNPTVNNIFWLPVIAMPGYWMLGNKSGGGETQSVFERQYLGDMEFSSIEYPFVLGCDVAGEVDSKIRSTRFRRSRTD